MKSEPHEVKSVVLILSSLQSYLFENLLCIQFFEKKILRIGRIEKLNFFEPAILNFFFASFPWKLVNIYNVAKMGRNFDA